MEKDSKKPLRPKDIKEESFESFESFEYIDFFRLNCFLGLLSLLF